MGESFYNSKNEEESTKDAKQMQQSSQLEVDIRETLKSCQLPLTPQVAQTLLIQIGHWSNATTTSNNKNDLPTPWSPDTLQAALLYVQACAKRRLALSSEIKSSTTIDINDGRINLTQLPSICMCQAQTSYIPQIRMIPTSCSSVQDHIRPYRLLKLLSKIWPSG